MKLDGKVAVVTGATKGLGKEIAIEFLNQGAKVVCAARSAGDFYEEFKDYKDQVYFHHVDVRQPESTKNLIQDSIDRYGKIDVMVANAGIHKDERIEKMSYEDWTDVMETNLNGVFNCTRAVCNYMIDRGEGRIINISSAAASRVNIGQANYCASKSAVEMFTKVCAIELGNKGVLVNCLSPGVIYEGMGEKLSQNKKLWDKYIPRFALKRPGTGVELANSALFLASEESSYVNGHILEVNGGLLWA